MGICFTIRGRFPGGNGSSWNVGLMRVWFRALFSRLTDIAMYWNGSGISLLHEKKRLSSSTKWMLVLMDSLCYLAAALLVFVVYPSSINHLNVTDVLLNLALGYVCVMLPRLLMKIYHFIWRYAGSGEYIKLILADAVGTLAFLLTRSLLPKTVTFMRVMSLICLNLLGAIMTRLVYQYIYQMRGSHGRIERIALKLLKWLTGVSFQKETAANPDHRIKIAVIGAGSVGVLLAEELLKNPKAAYQPVCFVDVDREKVGRSILGIDVISPTQDLEKALAVKGVQEVIFALPSATAERKKELYDQYKALGYKIKVYDYPSFGSTDSSKRHLRDFNIEELLFRRTANFIDEKTAEWYHGKSVLITGGGGSIGSELARQIAKVGPARLVLLDIYENGVYDIQQELLMQYGSALNLRVEIANVCDRSEMEKIFSRHTPDIVLHAAAHKHVPLMERNCCEAVRNNVFGTLTTVETCEKYGVKRFIMISTDKAVNPTNVMGATKRMCEMIVQSRSGKTTSFSATRFGNVLGSNGSVIPLFRRQIASGGPLTVTDKRIIRYFMTIPEASQLVMASGAMAKNGELYVLDMGKPVKILDLAESMVRLSGLEPYKDIDIIETGLRPGEKLYEELLIKTEELDKTENNMIFVERDQPLSADVIEEKLEILRRALQTDSNSAVKQALMQVVPTYHTPEEVNQNAIEAEEMKLLEQQRVG